MTAWNIIFGRRPWTRVEVHIFERRPDRSDIDGGIALEHGDSTPRQPLSYETFETHAYVLTHIPSKDKARWNFNFGEEAA